MVFLQVQIKIMATGCDEEQGEQNQLLCLHHTPPRDWWRLSISYWTNIGFELQHFQYWFKAAEQWVKEEGLLSYWLKKNMKHELFYCCHGDWMSQTVWNKIHEGAALPTCCMGWGFFFSSNQHEARGEATNQLPVSLHFIHTQSFLEAPTPPPKSWNPEIFWFSLNVTIPETKTLHETQTVLLMKMWHTPLRLLKAHWRKKSVKPQLWVCSRSIQTDVCPHSERRPSEAEWSRGVSGWRWTRREYNCCDYIAFSDILKICSISRNWICINI